MQEVKKLNERGKKMLNVKLERHLTRHHTFLHEFSAFIYIYIYIDSIRIDKYMGT